MATSGMAATIHVPKDYPTIQAGVDAAVNGDHVVVADGVYTGAGNIDIDLGNKVMVLESANGNGSCVIDCQEQGSGVYAGVPGSLIRGFTIKHSLEDWYYGGVVGYYGGTVADCVITDNWIGVYSSDCGMGVVLQNCIIKNNIDGIYACFSEVDAVDSIITGNITYDIYSDVMATVACFNCYVTGDIFVYYSAEVIFNSCTIQGEIGGYVDSYIQIRNSIFWPSSTFGTEDTYWSVQYSDIQYGFSSGEGNINVDPHFVSGPYGNFYLSSIAGGQAVDSPCIDAGNAPAENVCYPLQGGPLCMGDMTTNTNSVADTGIVDMGFHYHPYQDATPTPTPTMTPDPEDTPTPTATPSDEGVTLILNQSVFQAGDLFKLRASCSGPANATVDLYIMLDVMGSYWFYPDWTETVCCETFILSEQQLNYKFILDFTWPSEDFGHADGLGFWGAMCDAGTMNTIGSLDHVMFAYQ